MNWRKRLILTGIPACASRRSTPIPLLNPRDYASGDVITAVDDTAIEASQVEDVEVLPALIRQYKDRQHGRRSPSIARARK